MKIINKQKRSLVLYDEVNDTFIKYFYPKISSRIKYFFRFRKYPGENYAFISKVLNSLGINTAEILSFDKYSVITKNLNAPTLENYISTHKNSTDIINLYVNTITILLKNNIYCGDFSYDNFLIKDNKLFAIDLEDYRKVTFFKKDTKEAIRRLSGKADKEIIEQIKKNLNVLD